MRMGTCAGSCADDEATVTDRILESFHDSRGIQRIEGPDRTPLGVEGRKRHRANEIKMLEGHRFHRARDRTDVAWMPGLDQNDAHVVEETTRAERTARAR